MSSFTDPLELEYIDGRSWRVTRNFTYYHGDLRTGWPITVPKGFVTDFASVPRGLWNLLPPTSACGKASVVHDWLYTTQPCTRKEADAVLLEAMEVVGVGRVKRYTVYWAVRVGGAGIWKRHTAELLAPVGGDFAA